MPAVVPGRKPISLVNLFSWSRLEHEVDERGAEVLVLGLLEPHEVAAARERGVLAARAGRLELGADLALRAPAWSAMIEL